MVTTLVSIGLILAVISLIYTVNVGKTVNAQKGGEHDHNSKTAEKHPLLLNPVLLAYVLGFGILFIFIFVLAMQFY
ncbi:hypothetical protein JCM21714_3608 [Gracilibacillus boraciitolerans JCM 21714]|uniref:Uncharacterized protein n=1 Tax=Gracilibacillus boraciitolerans JCM 21714 TaxID=1298598 RepID=W4VMU9_9BACI|nr:hypothetical protein [Gracilibacillus boraciitolerans]GAE94451.1 hypothetical protein JCM21714_3608 [Gracilibacillus boraciitolerans JCM 21714]